MPSHSTRASRRQLGRVKISAAGCTCCPPQQLPWWNSHWVVCQGSWVRNIGPYRTTRWIDTVTGQPNRAFEGYIIDDIETKLIPPSEEKDERQTQPFSLTRSLGESACTPPETNSKCSSHAGRCARNLYTRSSVKHHGHLRSISGESCRRKTGSLAFCGYRAVTGDQQQQPVSNGSGCMQPPATEEDTSWRGCGRMQPTTEPTRHGRQRACSTDTGSSRSRAF